VKIGTARVMQGCMPKKARNTQTSKQDDK